MINFKYISNKEFAQCTGLTWLELVYHNSALLGLRRTSDELRQQFGKLLTIFPLTEKQNRIYEKLNQNGRFGILSAHAIKFANQIGVPKCYIEQYINSKAKFKKFQSLHKELNSVGVNTYLEQRKYLTVSDLNKTYIRYKDYYLDVYTQTNSILSASFELYLKQNKQIG